MGVTKIRDNYWRARYTLKGETHNVGHFKTKREAQSALDHDKLHREIGLEADDPAPIADFGDDAFQDPDSKEFAEGLPVREGEFRQEYQAEFVGKRPLLVRIRNAIRSFRR